MLWKYQRFFSTEAGGGAEGDSGGDGQEGQDGQDVEELTDEQLSGGQPTAAAADEDTTGKEGDAGTKGDDKAKPAESSAAADADATAGDEGGGGGEKLLAGKYKTEAELEKGIVEAGKVLKYEELVLQRTIELAKKAGDPKALEDIYKSLDTAISQNKKAELAAAKPAGSDPNQDTRKPDNGMDAEAVTLIRVALDETVSTVLQSEVMQELKAEGVSIPDNFLYDTKATEAFMRTLRKDWPGYYRDVRDLVEKTYRNRLDEAKEVFKAQQGVDGHNSTMREQESKKILDYAKKIGLEVKPEDLTAALEELAKSPFVFEERHGVKYLRENALSDSWYLKNREKIEEQIRVNAEVNGRKQHKEDLDAMRKKFPNSISSSPVASSRKEQPAQIDVEDPDQVELLTDEQLFGKK